MNPTLTADVTAVTVGDDHACALVMGVPYCWGGNEHGQLGDGTTNSTSVPQIVPAFSSGGVTAIAAGSGFTCAVVNGGAKCWGQNGSGQLGNGSTTNSLTPVDVTGLTSGVNAMATASPGNVACAIVNGSAKCWGFGMYGQLGNGTGGFGAADATSPVQVSGLTSGVTAIAIGEFSACAIAGGAAKCWGSNANGALGDNDTANSYVPVQVYGLTSGL